MHVVTLQSSAVGNWGSHFYLLVQSWICAINNMSINIAGEFQVTGSAALRFAHSQDIRDIRDPNAFKTRIKCTCHESALSVTRQTCTWNCPVKIAGEL